MPPLHEVDNDILVAERLDEITESYGDSASVHFGPAIFAGLRITVISVSDRFVWYRRDKKEGRIPRHWLIGNCRQGGKDVI